MSRQNQYLDTLVVDGKDCGVWDKLDGGEVDSSELKYKPGGMAPEVSLGGTVSVGNVTLERLFDIESRDDSTLLRWLASRTGAAVCTVSRQPLDRDGHPFGKPLVYAGRLKTVNPGPTDSNSEAASLWTVVISTAGNVG